jgi:hypothetical protein
MSVWRPFGAVFAAIVGALAILHALDNDVGAAVKWNVAHFNFVIGRV